MSKTILITGGAGFIGSHVVRLFVSKYPDYKIVNLDKLIRDLSAFVKEVSIVNQNITANVDRKHLLIKF